MTTLLSSIAQPRRWLPALGATLSCSLLLSACIGGSDEPSYPPIELNIAHINDHHSQLDGFTSTQLTLDGVATQVDLGGFARQSAVFKALAGTPNLLKLHAGDAMTGSLYYTFFKGAADAALMNTVCFDAFIPGNHEFDDGDATLKGFLDELAKGSCQTPTLAANIVPQSGTALAPAGGPAYLKPYTIKLINGVKVGLIGITVSGKTTQSSRPLATTRFLDELTSAQGAIDQLKAQGVRHIVLMTHQGYDTDRAMAAQLTDVDVIIGGDSHTLLGDFSAQGISSSSGAYPTVVRNKNGQLVCIGQAWEYGKAIGLMNVRFDSSGAVSSCSGQASLVIGDSFKRQDSAGVWQPLSATDNAALAAKLAQVPALKVTAPDAAAVTTLSAYSGQVAAQKAIAIGSASEALCLVRVPGESTNRSGSVAGCSSANTLARGSDAAQVVAEAFLNASQKADVALQNAGGVRVALPAGTLTMNDAFTILPFTNVLVELSLTGAEIVAALEDGASSHLDAAVPSTGAHPYAAGLRWDLDMSQVKGARFRNVEVRNRSTGTWSALQPSQSYTVVTNDFVAAGQDGYTTLGNATKAGRAVNTYLLYTQSFVDYVQAHGSIARPARADYSHKSVITKAGLSLP
ncbi:MAG: hypothetical protein RJA44_998 [Pseudomonadota bacterium]